MRWQVLAVALGVAAALAGGALVGRWCLGVVLIAAGSLGVFAGVKWLDDGQPRPAPRVVPFAEGLERARQLGEPW